jgi:hypothetical protein
MRALVETVKAQQFFALTVNLTCDLQGDPLVGHQCTILQSKRDHSSLNFGSA